MFDLDAEVRYWRKRQERRSSLSPRELDELEDHLRARVDLELEFNGTLAPRRAFALARRSLGEPIALSREFAKARAPRWRRWLFAGWAMFVASFVLAGAPTLPFLLRGYGLPATLGEALGDIIWQLRPITNLLMLATLLELRAFRPHRTRWLAVLVSLSVVLNFGWMVAFANPFVWLPLGRGIGHGMWVASFFSVAVALWMRYREWVPATLGFEPAQPAVRPRPSDKGVLR